MTESEIINEKVVEFINEQKMFTSVHITNSIKRSGTWIGNSNVANWLRNNFEEVNEKLGDSYCVTLIPVVNNTRKAYLYHPFFSNPDNFNDRNADTMTIDEFQKTHGYSFKDAKAQPVNKISTNSKPITFASTSKPKSKTSINLSARTITEKSNGRIRIPAAFIKALGLKPGDKVAKKINLPNLSEKIAVQCDYRVSIRRQSLNLGKGPVRMFIKDSMLTIEKI